MAYVLGSVLAVETGLAQRPARAGLRGAFEEAFKIARRHGFQPVRRPLCMGHVMCPAVPGWMEAAGLRDGVARDEPVLNGEGRRVIERRLAGSSAPLHFLCNRNRLIVDPSSALFWGSHALPR
jgi:hypothetical protein